MTALNGERLALEPAFSVAIGTQLLGTFTECSGLAAEYETYTYAEGGNNMFIHTLRGRLHHPVVTLKGGVTDHGVLLGWALESGPPIVGRATVTVTFHDPAGNPLRRFQLVEAKPVRWTGPTGNASANAVATESLEIAHRGLH